MNKRIATYLLLSALLGTSGSATEKEFTEGFEFLPSSVNTADSVSGISLIGEKVVFSRNDSTYYAEQDSASFDLINYESAQNWDDKAIGQTTYDTTTSTLYYSADGKLYSVVLNPEKKQSPKALTIQGVTNLRHEFENTSIASRNWRYKERDTVKIYNPAIANGGTRIYFSAEIEGGLGGKDIWFIDKIEGKNNKWSKPQNISRIGKAANDTTSAPTNAINSASNEDHPFLVNDSTILFSSDRQASLSGWNLYSAQIETGAEAKLLPDEINSNADDKAIVETDRSLYVLSNRNGVDQIFSPFPFHVSKIDEELLADVAAVEPEENPTQGNEMAENLSSSNSNNSKGKEKEKRGSQPESGQEGNTYTLYFKFSQDILIDDYDKEIKEVVAYINQFPDNRFLICGHTDHIGSKSYNQKLSVRRAKKVYDLLIEKGINKKQLKYKGYGSTQPKVKEAVSQEDLQKNRRVEIIKVDK